ncbi:MAG: aminotransferase class I/II-fold pyridoxal phosphate-dependent enzyme [candidate division Zixibacteria bacterium]|nr:aminotransferase class I/II-fold pyridoxal phosphate-dependent enzyme [candidate division Zixibacteria bacterium]
MVITKVQLEKANRLFQMPPGLMSFVRSEERKGLLKRDDVIDLAGFSWPAATTDRPLSPSALLPAGPERLAELRDELAAWLSARYGCRVVADREIFIGGSITSLATMLALAFLDGGDIAFVPELGLPSYRQAVTSAGAEPVSYTMSAKSGWMPDFERLGSRLGRVARLAFVNSPHNPTGMELSESDMAGLVWTASREHLLIVNDAAYQSIAERPPVSVLSVTGGSRVGLELHSFAYSLGLPRLPFGFAVGNRDAVSTLKQVARLIPVTLPAGYVDVAIDAIRTFPNPALRGVRQLLTRTADRASALLELLGLQESTRRTIPFLWARIPSRRDATAFARQLFRRHRILVCPGTDFGDGGEGYLRFSLTVGDKAYEEAIGRIKKRRLLRTVRKEAQ